MPSTIVMILNIFIFYFLSKHPLEFPKDSPVNQAPTPPRGPPTKKPTAVNPKANAPSIKHCLFELPCKFSICTKSNFFIRFDF